MAFAKLLDCMGIEERTAVRTVTSRGADRPVQNQYRHSDRPSIDGEDADGGLLTHAVGRSRVPRAHHRGHVGLGLADRRPPGHHAPWHGLTGASH